MKKDVIYIDVEDDITAVVAKIKASKEKIIALVPPSRLGALQSSVSMRLLQRTAEQAKKRVVLISNNKSLIGLAAAAGMPVAKNLQSRPEMVEVPVLKVDDDDIIDGEMLPVGEHAKSAETDDDGSVDEVIAASAPVAKAGLGQTAAKASVVTKTGKKIKAPDFTTFRKKLLLFGGLGALLLLFLVWAIWFAPKATVVIAAKTTTVTIDDSVSLSADQETSIETKTVKAQRQEQKKDLSVEFTPTGKKEVGEKATGQVRFSSDSFSALLRGIDIPAGTTINSTSGAAYVTDSGVTLNTSGNSKTVGVTAAEIGESYNAATGSVSGAPSGVSARFTSATSGGTSREVTVVSEEDVAKATEKLNEQKDDSLKDKLKGAFGSSSVMIDASFRESRAEPSPSVAIDQEASGPVTLKTTITASMMAIDKVDLSKYLNESIQAEIEGKDAQKIYKDGVDDVKFAQFSEVDGASKVRITANGTVGPTVDEDNVKEQSMGKTYGEIQSSLERIEGVDDVDIKFSPFWVSKVPNDANRITVEFDIRNAG